MTYPCFDLNTVYHVYYIMIDAVVVRQPHNFLTVCRYKTLAMVLEKGYVHLQKSANIHYTGADPDFNKGGCLNEKDCTVAKPLSQLLCSCVGGYGRGFPLPRKARKLEQLGYSVIQKYCKMQ